MGLYHTFPGETAVLPEDSIVGYRLAPYLFGAKSWNSQMVGASLALRMFKRT
jgi:hypothetical protein